MCCKQRSSYSSLDNDVAIVVVVADVDGEIAAAAKTLVVATANTP